MKDTQLHQQFLLLTGTILKSLVYCLGSKGVSTSTLLSTLLCHSVKSGAVESGPKCFQLSLCYRTSLWSQNEGESVSGNNYSCCVPPPC